MVANIIGYGLISLLAIFVQSSLIRLVWPNAIVPDIFCAMVVVIGLRNRDWLSLLGVFAIGLLADLSQARYLGPEAGAAVVVFMLAGLLADRVYADKFLALGIVVAICSLIKQVFVLGLIAIYVSLPAVNTTVVISILLESLITAVCAPVVAKILLYFGCLTAKNRRLGVSVQGIGASGLLPNKTTSTARSGSMRALYR